MAIVVGGDRESRILQTTPASGVFWLTGHQLVANPGESHHSR